MRADEILKKFGHLETLLGGMPKDINLSMEKYTPERIIVQKGDAIEKVYIVATGDMLVYNEYESGEIIYVESEKITIIGDIELLSGLDYFVCSVIAKGDCSAITMSIHDFLRWFEEDPNIAKEIAIRLSNRNCRQALEIGSIKYHSTEYRVIQYINTLAQKKMGTKDNVRLKVTRLELSHAIGASERMVNRVISSMKKKQLIATSYGVINVARGQMDRMTNWLEENS